MLDASMIEVYPGHSMVQSLHCRQTMKALLVDDAATASIYDIMHTMQHAHHGDMHNTLNSADDHVTKHVSCSVNTKLRHASAPCE